jgi:uncharacterized protein YraI
MKHTHVWRWIGAAALAMTMPLAASAQEAFARGAVNLRAGPSGDYPLVARLGPGQPFDLLGCTRGYAWCDVVLPDGLRGWVYAGSIDYAYDRQRVPLASYGAMIGVPIVGFTIGNYWGDHYRDRPWYREQRYWRGHPPPPPPVAGWRPVPPPRPGWQPNPWHDRDPGYRPHPGYRPQPGWQAPPPGPRPPPEYGYRPPRPDRDIRPPQPGPDFRPPRPDHPGGRPPQFGQPNMPPAMRAPQVQPGQPPAAFPPGSLPRAAADMRQQQMDRINRPQSSSADRP